MCCPDVTNPKNWPIKANFLQQRQPQNLNNAWGDATEETHWSSLTSCSILAMSAFTARSPIGSSVPSTMEIGR